MRNEHNYMLKRMFLINVGLNSKSLEVRNKSEKSEKIRAKSKKFEDEDAMLCHTWWSDRQRLINKSKLSRTRLK